MCEQEERRRAAEESAPASSLRILGHHLRERELRRLGHVAVDADVDGDAGADGPLLMVSLRTMVAGRGALQVSLGLGSGEQEEGKREKEEKALKTNTHHVTMTKCHKHHQCTVHDVD